MKKKFKGIVASIAVLAGLAVGLSSCLDGNEAKDPNVQLEEEVQRIDDYLTANSLTAIKDISGVRMVVSSYGTGFPARQGSTINVDYVGKLFDTGVEFDNHEKYEAPLSKLIKGWLYAFTTLPEGTRATLYIPSAWGYGNQANNGIPANSTLVFNIAFNKVVRTTAEMQRLGTDTVAIDNYLTTKGIVAIKDTTGLRYVINEIGGGAKPTLYSKVKFHAKYMLLSNDTKVVAELDFEPSDATYNRVIDQDADGLKAGLQKIPINTRATFYLPSKLGFGSESRVNGANETVIPANANLIVEVTLKEIVTP